MKPSFRFLSALSPKAKRQLRASSLGGAFAISALTLMVSSSPLLGASLYWDVNGTTAGFSDILGVWNTGAFWNTDSGGGAGTLSATTASADDLFISQATTNTGNITLSGATKNASSITFLANVGPTVSLTSGATIKIGGSGAFSGIRQQSTGDNAIASALQLNSGNTAFEFSNSSTGLLTIGGAVTGTATSGNATLASNLTSDGGSFTKLGAGTLTLSGASTYGGATTVSEGKLVVNGSITTSITTTVSSGATLGGSGSVGALTINSGGFVTPGNSPGVLAVNGNYSQAGEYTAEIANTTAGTGYDQIDVIGTVDISGGSLVTSFSGTYAQNDLLFLLLNDDTDAINGTFAGYAQGATFASYGYMDWQISYTAQLGKQYLHRRQ